MEYITDEHAILMRTKKFETRNSNFENYDIELKNIFYKKYIYMYIHITGLNLSGSKLNGKL